MERWLRESTISFPEIKFLWITWSRHIDISLPTNSTRTSIQPIHRIFFFFFFFFLQHKPKRKLAARSITHRPNWNSYKFHRPVLPAMGVMEEVEEEKEEYNIYRHSWQRPLMGKLVLVLSSVPPLPFLPTSACWYWRWLDRIRGPNRRFVSLNVANVTWTISVDISSLAKSLANLDVSRDYFSSILGTFRITKNEYLFC